MRQPQYYILTRLRLTHFLRHTPSLTHSLIEFNSFTLNLSQSLTHSLRHTHIHPYSIFLLHLHSLQTSMIAVHSPAMHCVTRVVVRPESHTPSPWHWKDTANPGTNFVEVTLPGWGREVSVQDTTPEVTGSAWGMIKIFFFFFFVRGWEETTFMLEVNKTHYIVHTPTTIDTNHT